MSSVRGPVIAGNRSRSRPMIASRLVDRERRLREVGDPGRILDLERVDVGLALDEHDRGRGLAHRPLDLLVAGVADEHDRVAVGGELDRLAVDLGHERAGGVDRPQPARLGVGVDGRRDAVGGEHRHRALGDRVAELVDEDRPARARAPRPRACCGRSPCARRPAARGGRARARPSGRRGRRRRSSRAARRAAASRERSRPAQSTNEPEDRLAARVERLLRHRAHVVAGLVPAVVRPRDQVDRRAPRASGTACGRR